MNEFDLKSLQNTQMRIMDDIHRVCVETGLRYYLIGGSAIGAIRHNGIIPWDIDIDIAMPRKDYEIFVKEAPGLLKSEFEIHDSRTDKNFGTYHALVVLKDSVLKFKYEQNSSILNRFGIFVDVLPLDQWPDDEKKKQWLIRKHNWLKLIRTIWHGRLNYNVNPITRLLKKFLHYIIHSIFTLYQLNKIEQDIITCCNTEDEGKIWCSKLSHYKVDKLTMPKEYFGKPVLHAFSGREYYVPEQVENYLTHLFGDYMKLPPEEKRYEQIDSVEYASWKAEDGKLYEIQ